MQPNQNSSTQGGFDSSGTAIADASHVQAGYGGMDGGMYYTLNGYPAHHGYFIGGKYKGIFNEKKNFQRTGSYSDFSVLVLEVYVVLLTSDLFRKKQVMTILWIGMIIQGMSLRKVATLRMQ